jgi:hypothetical protein
MTEERKYITWFATQPGGCEVRHGTGPQDAALRRAVSVSGMGGAHAYDSPDRRVTKTVIVVAADGSEKPSTWTVTITLEAHVQTASEAAGLR